MNWKLITVGVVVLSLLVYVSYAFKSSIKSFVKQGFQNRSVPKEREFALFYATWCPHCKPVLPEFEKLASDDEIVKSLKVSMYEADKDKEICGNFKITGYPTIKLIETDGSTTDYSGKRTYEEFKEFLKDKLNSN